MNPALSPSDIFGAARRRADHQADPNPFDSHGLLRDGFFFKMTKLPPRSQSLTLSANTPVTTKENEND
jgi:hypothetical protein